ncbi:UDP-glucosyltransferase 2-like [Venturia canescens]|uniref:UDP-glucosyltransferase 2-like n=1 Tax=Venturia canescens TaxID=32260 RepID=UPI001C9D272A|nr:UDP-glucosyltransferase 2-like [Venturia canescens]
MWLLRVCVVLLLIINVSWGFKILGICPSPSYSHQQPFQALMKALAARGHRVTVISPIPLKETVENYRDIDVSFTYRKKDCTGLRHVGAFELLRRNMMESNEVCEEQIRSVAVQNLIKSKNESFDAIVIEQLWFQCYYALVKKYNFPVLIGFLSVGNLPYAMDSVGNPDDPILNPDMAFNFSNRMNTIEGIINLLYTAATRFYYRHCHLPRAQQIASKIVSGTCVNEIDKNFSLVILGNNHVFGYPKPLLPNVVEVHSLQIGEKPGTLPEDIQEFLDGSQNGVVYFSLGSNLQTHQLPADSLTALVDALGSLKQRILWKHQGDGTQGNGNGSNGDKFARAINIKFVKWVPQQAVLAHPKVLAYMMQGGLQSLQEAVHYAVPVIAIPFFGDQNFNARKILDSEIGLTLDVDTMTNETIVRVVTEVITNEKYRRNMKRMSDITKDELVKPMDRAVWSVEHVVKFQDSKHFQYHGRDITYLQYYSPFIVLLLLFATSLLLCLTIVRLGKSILRKLLQDLLDKMTKSYNIKTE